MDVVVGIAREVNVKEGYVVVGDVKVYFKGLWTCNGVKHEFHDVLSMISLGEEITIKYYVSMDGRNFASKVVLEDGTVCEKIGASR